MKKFIALVLALVMVFGMTANVFAVTELTTSTAMATIRIDGYKDGTKAENGYYYYDSQNGIINYVKDGDDATGKGDLIMPEQENGKYAFTATTNGTVYHYQLLDEITVDGKKQYYIYCNDSYGKNPVTDAANNAFDPDVEKNIAHWLNNEFYNGSAVATDGIALDTGIKPYIVNHDWLIEANEKAPEGYPKTDYSVNCKIALLSISEYAKYAENISWGLYEKGVLTSAGIHMFLRSPVGNATHFRTLYAQNGCTSNTAATYATARIRPAFYVSEDYFKNVKLDLDTAGSGVKSVIAELNPSIYSDDEKLSLKGITVLSEDGSNGSLSTDEWTNATKATVDESGVINLPNNAWIGRLLEMNGGTVEIEADVVSVTSGGLYIGFCEGTGSPGYKYPLALKGSITSYITNPPQADSAKYKRLENSSNELWYTKFSSTADVAGTYRVKLNVNLSNGDCYTVITGVGSDGNNYVKYSEVVNLGNYINSEKTFSKVAFWNSSTDKTVTKIDNIKITYDKNGNAFESVKALDEKTLVVTFKDYVNTDSVTAADVLVSNNTVNSVVSNGNKITVKLEKKLSVSGGDIIVNNLKRADSLNAAYTVAGNGFKFDYEVAEYSADVKINNPLYTKGSTVTATAAVTAGNTSGKALELILAAYKGNKIVGISEINRFTVESGNADGLTKTASLTLDSDADTFKAFLWDENMIPAAFDIASVQ